MISPMDYLTLLGLAALTMLLLILFVALLFAIVYAFRNHDTKPDSTIDGEEGMQTTTRWM